MSVPPPNLPLKPIPVARRARDPVIPAVEIDEQAAQVDPRSPWEWHGWAASLLLHLVLLTILGLWFFTQPRSEVKTFDTTLAGKEQGSDEGLTALGGLDTPISLPDAIQPPPETSSLERIKPIELAADPTAGFAGSVRNPGAGLGDGFGLAKYGSGGETIKGVEVKVGDPQFTLIWDSVVDLDLHVIEPGGKEIYWNEKQGKFGGELDVDNTEGFGPENIYWLKLGADGSRDLGAGPPGEYRWFIEYYGGNRGNPVATRWKVRVKHEGRSGEFQGRLTVPGSRSRHYSLKLEDPSGSAPSRPPPPSTR